MVDVRGQHEIVASLQQLAQLHIQRVRAKVIAVHHDVAAPKRPVFLGGDERVETAGIHVGEAVALAEVGECALEALA